MKYTYALTALVALTIFTSGCATIEHPEYDLNWRSKCVSMTNGGTKVTVDPTYGGRIVEYSLNGENIIHEVEENKDWIYPEGDIYKGPTGGRFDVGPEVAPHPTLWEKGWQVDKVDKLFIRIVSAKDKESGLQLIREFTLSPDSSKLICKQIMKNISDEPLNCSYWGRTLVKGGGISFVPLEDKSRFPKKYLLYSGWPTFLIETEPELCQNIDIFKSFAAIKGQPKYTKIGFDSTQGWLGYAGTNDLLFTKTFKVYPGKQYSDIAGITSALWYYKDKLCEIEPMGPMETIKPGAQIEFQEEWKLFEYTFPKIKSAEEIKKIYDLIQQKVK